MKKVLPSAVLSTHEKVSRRGTKPPEAVHQAAPPEGKRTRRVPQLVASVVALLLITGLAIATNMGYKIVYFLHGDPVDGLSNPVSLPYVYESAETASDLLQYLNDQLGSGTVPEVSRFVSAADAASFYSAAVGGEDFTINPGEGYIIKMSTDAYFRNLGSHDPSVALPLSGPQPCGTCPLGDSTGTNLISLPFHTVPTNADELMTDIEAQAGDTVISVQRFIATSGQVSFYSEGGGDNFPIVRGEAYYIQVTTDVTYIPTHY